MTPFEHLAVLISIVLGLGLTQLLLSAHRLVQARERVTFYGLPVAWATILFVSLIEWWWSSFSLRTETVWNFFYFLFILLSPVSLYLAAAAMLVWLATSRRPTHHMVATLLVAGLCGTGSPGAAPTTTCGNPVCERRRVACYGGGEMLAAAAWTQRPPVSIQPKRRRNAPA